MSSITIELPFPPTANRYWQPVRGRLIKTKRALNYRNLVSTLLLKNSNEIRKWNPETDKDTRTLAIAVAVHYPKKKGPDGDIDNLLKVLIDCLEGSLFENDRQIRHVQISRENQETKEGSVRVTLKECPHEMKLHDGTFTVMGIHA